MTLHFAKAVLGIVCSITTVLYALPFDIPKIPVVEDSDIPVVEDTVIPVVEDTVIPLVEDLDIPDIEDLKSCMEHLCKYGYMDEPIELSVEISIIVEALVDPLKAFQEMAGLNVTGTLNSETIVKMKEPRCGMKDIIRNLHETIGRKKRETEKDSKWPTNNLTYRMNKLPKLFTDRVQVRHEMIGAYKMWSDVAMLYFTEITGYDEVVDMDIDFESREHGDGEPFDGPGGVLAHAGYPYEDGDTHFDDEEPWTINERRDAVIIQVAVHEFGHALGLIHSEDPDAVMSPYVFGYSPFFVLHEDDIKRIQKLYGANPNDAPDLCQDASIDTITRTQDGSTYVFKGLWYWQIIDNKTADGYPRKISDDWRGLEGNLDASFTEPEGNTYFFKGGRYWNFTNKRMNHDPNLILRGFPEIPDFVDAAFSFNDIGKIFFFKADQYWRFDKTSDPPVKPEYPKPITEFTGLPPESIDAAYVEVDNPVYFFTKDRYYLYDEKTSKVPDADPPYPRPTARDWFSCSDEET